MVASIDPMWVSPEPGMAQFRANGWKLAVTAEISTVGGSRISAVRIMVCRDGLVGASAQICLPGIELPPVSDSFIRGDAFHLSFAELPDHPIGLDLVLLGVEADEEQLVFESVMSINTLLLDSWPQLELRIGTGHPGQPRWGEVPLIVLDETDSVRWWYAQPRLAGLGANVATHLACEARDLGSLDPSLPADPCRLRFFGDFLEKGVIRRISPWWVWSNGMIPRSTGDRLAAQLQSRPLPLGS
jgi:hypothetical protein